MSLSSPAAVFLLLTAITTTACKKDERNDSSTTTTNPVPVSAAATATTAAAATNAAPSPAKLGLKTGEEVAASCDSISADGQCGVFVSTDAPGKAKAGGAMKKL